MVVLRGQIEYSFSPGRLRDPRWGGSTRPYASDPYTLQSPNSKSIDPQPPNPMGVAGAAAGEWAGGTVPPMLVLALRSSAASRAVVGQGAAGAVSAREKQPSGRGGTALSEQRVDEPPEEVGVQVALDEYRLEVAAHLHKVGAPVLLTLLGQDVPRPPALAIPAMVAMFAGDARFRVDGGMGRRTLSLAGSAGKSLALSARGAFSIDKSA